MIIKAPKGTMDVVPENSFKWQFIEDKIREITKEFGISEIRTPVFEHTELFQRGVGDTTDVVEKEMYTFNDKGDRSITLRPEGTAGAVRLFIEHGLFNNPMPIKTFYLTSCYRYEKPQAGRLREFHQFGVEYFGTQNPSADAEMMQLPMLLYRRLGLKGLTLNINSIGCPKCRKAYNEKLREYLSGHYDELCDTCKSRYERNPMRILDCKSPVCKQIAKGAPLLIDNICQECEAHFEKVKKYLEAVGMDYEIDPYIVRGLDYYTKSVFEITAQYKNSNNTICGGGRYDKMVGRFTGMDTPACGFSIGFERIVGILMDAGFVVPEKNAREAWMYEKGMGMERLSEILKEAMAARAEGKTVLVTQMNKNKKFQKEQLGKEGYTEFKEFYKEELKR